MSDPSSPFHDSAGNPRPEGLEGGYLELRDGWRIRYARCPAASRHLAARGTVLLLQGRNEAVETYFETMAALAARGFDTLTFDWRGQGGSGRLGPFRGVGHLPRLQRLAGDLVEILDKLAPAGPLAILAHSTGGLVALAAIEHLEGRVERMALTAPFVGLRASRSGLRLVRFVCGLLHWTGLGFVPLSRAGRGQARFERNVLTSDRRRFERNAELAREAPDLFVPGLSASWLRTVLRAQRRIARSDVVARMRVPTLVLSAGADQVVDPLASDRLAWRMRSGHALTVPGARHELLQERDAIREPVLAAVEAFFATALPQAAVDLAPVERAVADLVA